MMFLRHIGDPGERETLAGRIRTYIRAKDENRPHLLEGVFSESAVLEMRVNTDAIAFPPLTRGPAGIADVLVRGFARQYENVYTFCLGRPPAAGAVEFACPWLVVMSEKVGGRVRAGVGRYDWSLTSDPRPCIARLVIEIEQMETLPAEAADQTFLWVQRLPYPWCPREDLTRHLPPIAELRALLQHLSEAPDRPRG